MESNQVKYQNDYGDFVYLPTTQYYINIEFFIKSKYLYSVEHQLPNTLEQSFYIHNIYSQKYCFFLFTKKAYKYRFLAMSKFS